MRNLHSLRQPIPTILTWDESDIADCFPSTNDFDDLPTMPHASSLTLATWIAEHDAARLGLCVGPAAPFTPSDLDWFRRPLSR